MKRPLPLVALALCAAAACNKPEPPPQVHRAVSATIEHFNPGLAMGQPLGEAVNAIGANRWVQHAGIVGVPRRRMFNAIRIYPDSAARAAPAMDPKAYVRFVELVNDGRGDRLGVMSDLAIAFRGVSYQGCVIIDEGEGTMRNVEYWTTPTDQGGAAVITEWGDTPLAEGDKVHWSLFLWSGPFGGADTFLLPFASRWCDGMNTAIVPRGLERTASTVASLQREFSDSVRRVFAARAAEAAAIAQVEDATDACMIPVAGSPTTTHDMGSYSIELPSDFTRDPSRPNAWKAPDRSEVTIRLGPTQVYPHQKGGTLTSHCENPINGRSTDVDLVDVMSGSTRVAFRVQARFAGQSGLAFDGEARTQARRLELIRAAYSIRK